jgi:hypothetical protein
MTALTPPGSPLQPAPPRSIEYDEADGVIAMILVNVRWPARAQRRAHHHLAGRER